MLAPIALPLSGAAAKSPTERASSRPKIDFNRDIRPIFSDTCYACHGPDANKRKAGLRLDQKEEAFKPAKSGNYAIVPGDVAKSKLIELIITEDKDEQMPPPESGKTLTKAQIDLLRQWVAEGAPWQNHWSYIPPERPALPTVKNKAWPRNEIDNFTLARLEREGLKPNQQADKTTLVRRASLDLTGLPPTIEEVDAFLADKSSTAYEKLVDRLLESPHFGERMGLAWLDLARYADTSGYHFDGSRHMWIWRDWVINAFNKNKPFDQFTVEQLAGDLMPNATLDQKVASGFHRNVMTTDEGGADPEEYLNKYVVDRVNTTAAVWLGTTLGCAECHDHKYDRISQKEFYQFYAFFHNVPEKGLDGTREDNPAPEMKLPTQEQGVQLIEYLKAIPEAEGVVKKRETELPAAQTKWEQEILAKLAKPVEPDGLFARYSLDETASGVDALGTYKPGTYKGTNAPPWTDGKLGKALRFDGMDDYIDAGNIADFERTNAFSFGCWAKIEAGGALLRKIAEIPTGRGFDLEVKEGKVLVHFINNWPENALEILTKEQLPKDGWVHLLVTYDGSSKGAGVKVYVQGKSQSLEIKTDKLSDTIRNQAPLQIGKSFYAFPFRGLIDDVRFYNRVLTPPEVEGLAISPNLAIVATPPDKRTDEQKQELKKYFRDYHATDLKKSEEELANVIKAKDALLKQIPSTMVMKEMEKPRDTFILVRGNFQNKGEKVSAAVPGFLPPAPEGAPANRLTLAKWLVSTNHPLTSRVTVNRYWQMFFGTGLVKTVNDFGSQGDWPSHPELLDWLATEFVASHWNIKAMVKLMVTSATYRQSAAVTPQILERDPYNRLLTRGPRFRLDAELLRDNALAISGLLNGKIGGESVKPYQPPGLWELTDRKYVQSQGTDLYRRGIYTYWKRSTPYPSFLTFDAPTRETCAVQRPRTSTPLQSLVLMNDPVYVEAARAFAERILREGGNDLAKQLTYAVRLAVARPPSKKELEILERTYHQQRENYQQDKEVATALVSIGESTRSKNVDVSELAAWTAVANVLLNLNETITK